MILNSPVFFAAIALFGLVGLALMFKILRTGLPGLDHLGLASFRTKSDSAQGSELGESQFRILLLQTITIPLLTFAVLVATLLYQINAIFSLNRWVQHSDKVLLTEGRVHTHIQETESSLRGYILSNHPEHSDFFLKSLSETPQLLSLLRNLTQDNPAQLASVNRISYLFQQWSESALQAHERRRKNQISLGAEINERGKIMEDIKAELAVFESTELALKQERWASTERAADSQIVLLVSLSIIAGVFLSVSGGHQLRRLSRSYTHLLEDVELANRDLEQKVQNRTLELTAINKELEAFCYSVSHDLRAPLRGIDGFSQILVEEYQGKIDENGVKYLNYIRQGVQKMGVLIDDLLNLSRLTRIEINFKDFDISEMALEVFTAIKATDPQRIVKYKGPDPQMVTADPGLIRIALENLFSNALKYSAQKEISEVEFGILETEKGLTYFVRDNGSGFDMKYYNKLFNVFQRLHDNSVYKGTGIGLATVKRVISRHGGEIWAESNPDVSTTFYFTLNRKAAA